MSSRHKRTLSEEHLTLSLRLSHLPEKSAEERLAHAQLIAAWQAEQKQRMVKEANAKAKIRAEKEEAQKYWDLLLNEELLASKGIKGGIEGWAKTPHTAGDSSAASSQETKVGLDSIVNVQAISKVIGGGTDRVKRFVYLWTRFGPPASHRDKVWSARIGNKLGIMPFAFQACVEASMERIDKKAQQVDGAGSSATNNNNAADNGSSPYSNSKVDAVAQIALDIPRTCIVSLIEQQQRLLLMQQQQQQSGDGTAAPVTPRFIGIAGPSLEEQQRQQQAEEENRENAQPPAINIEQEQEQQIESQQQQQQQQQNQQQLCTIVDANDDGFSVGVNRASTHNDNDDDDGADSRAETTTPVASEQAGGKPSKVKQQQQQPQLSTPKSSTLQQQQQQQQQPMNNEMASAAHSLAVTWTLNTELGGRQFPSYEAFVTDLEQVLRAVSEMMPEVGYVQGLSYLCSMLLNFCDANTTFVLLCNMLKHFAHLPAFFGAADDASLPLKMSVTFNAFKELFRETDADLSHRLAEVAVEPRMFCLDWFMTLFVRVLPMGVCVRLWDLILLDPAYTMRIALALVLQFETALRIGDPSMLQVYDGFQHQAAGEVMSPGTTQESSLLILTRVGRYKVDAEKLLRAVVAGGEEEDRRLPSLERIRACVAAHALSAPA